MELRADMELRTDDHQFVELFGMLSDAFGGKKRLQKEITELSLTGKARIDHFVDAVDSRTPEVLLEMATWENIAPLGFTETPDTFALRFAEAAAKCGKPTVDINYRFSVLVVEPWANDPELRRQMEVFGAQCLELAVNTQVQKIDEMDEIAARFEWKHAYTTALQRKLPTASGPRPSGGRASGQQGDGDSRPSDQEMAERLGLSTRVSRQGLEYYPCMKCYIMRGKEVFHSPKNCPLVKQLSGEDDEKDSGGKAMVSQSGGGAGSQREFLCWNCERPGHSWYQCKEPLKPHLQRRKEREE